MTASAIGLLRRRYLCILRQCALRNAVGLVLVSGLPAAMAQALNVVPDGRTATTVAQQGALATVSTATTRGATAFNSFSRFDVGSGAQVNLLLPAGSSNLVNLVSGARSQIDGWVNAYKDGRIGGNVFFFNPQGWVVGASGVLNAGSLTLAAPSATFMAQWLDPAGRINDGATLAALTGAYPLSASGLVRVQGTLNAADGVTLAAAQLQADAGARIAAGPAGAAAFAALVNVNGLDSAAGVSTAGGRIRLLASGDIALAGTLQAAPSADGSATLTATAGHDLTLSGAQLLSAGAAIDLTASHQLTLDGALVSGRNVGAGTLSPAAHDSATALGPAGAVALTAPQIALRNGSRVLAHGGNGQADAAVTLTASDTASTATFGSREDQTARITVNGSTVKGGAVTLQASANDKYIFASTQAVDDPQFHQELANSLLDAVTSLRAFVDVTVSKAEAAITVDGGALLQANSGNVTLQAQSQAEARMNVRSTIIGFGYGESTSRASVDVGNARLQASGDIALSSRADNTVSVEVGTSNIGKASNNASNPTGYANAAVAVGVGEQTAAVRTTSAAQLQAGGALSLSAGGTKDFSVASSGGSFQDGVASAGVSVGLSHSTLTATLGGTARANAVSVQATLSDDSGSKTEAAAGTAGSAVNLQEAVTSARTLDGSVLEFLGGLVAKIPVSDGRSGNKEKFGISASVAFADIDNRAQAQIAAGAQVHSGGRTQVAATATDNPVFRASAAVDERDNGDPQAGSNQQASKSVALSGAVVVAALTQQADARIGDGAAVDSAQALDVTARSVLTPSWANYKAVTDQLRTTDWTSTQAYGALGSKVYDLVTDPLHGNTWSQNSAESEKLSLTAAVTVATLTNQATARIGAARINSDGSGAAADGQAVRVAAQADQQQLHLAGVPELDGTLGSNNSQSGKVGIGGAYLQLTGHGGSDASIASGAQVRADTLAVSAHSRTDQVLVSENTGKAGKLSINGSFSLLQGEQATVAQIAAGSQVDARDVLLLAQDDSLTVNVGGGFARSGSVGIGFSVAINEADRQTQALLGNRPGETARGGTLNARGNLSVEAQNRGAVGAFTLAGSAPSGPDSSGTAKGGDGNKTAGGDDGGQGKSGVGISAAASVNNAQELTRASVQDLDSVSVAGRSTQLVGAVANDSGLTLLPRLLLPGVQVNASNPTLNLAAAGGLSIANGKTAGLAGAFSWNEGAKDTRAGFADTTVDADAALGASASNSNALWSVSAGANAGGKLSVAGSVAYSTIDNRAQALAERATLHTDGTLQLGATDSSAIRSVAGAASFGGRAGFGAALGLSEVHNSTVAGVSGGQVSAGALAANARADNEIIAVAAALAVSQGVAGSGAVTVNDIGNTTRAGLDQAAVDVGGGRIGLLAEDGATIRSGAGSVALTSGSAAIGLAAASNHIANTTSAEVLGGSSAGGTVSLAAQEDAQIDALAAGAAGGNNVGVTGSLSVNRIANTTQVLADGATLRAAQAVTLRATDSARLNSLTGAAAVGGNGGVGASASYNQADSTVAARVHGGTLAAADIAVVAERAATFNVWAIAGAAAGTFGAAGSIAMNLAGGQTTARIDGGAQVLASGNALLRADADDLVKARTGAAAVGGTAGVGGAISFNDLQSTTTAELSGTGTLLEGAAQGSATLLLPDGTLRERGTTERPSANPPSARENTETLHGAAVLATSNAAVENFAVTLAAGGTAAVAGTVSINQAGGQTRALVADHATLNRAGAGGSTAPQQGLVAAYHHEQLFSGSGGGAVAPTVGVGGAADTALLGHTTRASVSDAALAGRQAARVAATSSSEVTQGIVGLGGGLVGLAGSIGVVLAQSTTEALVQRSQVDAAQGRIDVKADNRSAVDVAAGAVAAGAVGIGVTATVTVATQTTRAQVLDSRLDAAQTTTVQATSDTAERVLDATLSAAGAAGVAGTVNVLVLKGSTEAEIGGTSLVNTRLATAGQDVQVRATDSVTLVDKVGGAGVAAGVGVGAAVDVVLLRSGARAAIDGSADVRAARDITVQADALRDIDALAVAGGAGLASGIAGAVSVVAVGGRPDSDSNDNASGSVAKAASLARRSATGNQLGAGGGHGGSAVAAAASRVDTARAGADLSGDFSATPTRLSAEAVAASTSRLQAGGNVAVGAHTQNDITSRAVGAAVSAGFSLGGGFAVAQSDERSRAAVLGRTTAGGDVRVTVLDDQAGDAEQKAYAGGGGAVGLAASLALNAKSSTASAELGGTVQAGGQVVVDAEVDHALQARGVGGAVGVLGIGAAIGRSQDSSAAQASLRNNTVLTAGGLAVTARAGSHTTTDVTAAAGGLFAGGAGADARSRNSVHADASLGDDVALRLGRGNALVSATATPQGEATARGVAISAGYSMGVSDADVAVTSDAGVRIGARLAATAGQLSLQAQTTRPQFTVGTVSVPLANADASALAAGGGLLVGASASRAVASVTPSTHVTVGDGARLALTTGLDAQALSQAEGRSDVSGLNIGLVAAGGNAASTTLRSDTVVQVGAGTIQAPSVVLLGQSGDTLRASATSGAGGLGVVMAAQVDNQASAHTDVQLAGRITADRVDVAARHTTTLHGAADSTMASVAGYSGANVDNRVDNTTRAALADGSTVAARAFKLDALTTVAKDSADADWAVRAAAGGALAGAAGGTLTTIDNVTRADVGAGARITTQDQGGQVAQLDITARNRLDVYDGVLLDTGGAVAVARSESFTDARRNDAQVGLGSGALLHSARDVQLEASTSGVVANEAQSKTYGLAGAAEGASRSRIVTANGITLDGARIESDADVQLRAGAGNGLRADAQTRLWNRTAVPMPGSPDALGQLVQDNRIVIRPYALPAGTLLSADEREAQVQRAAIATVQDIRLLAGGGERSVRGFGRGTDLYREALQALGQIFDSSLSLDTQAGASIDQSAATVQVDGTVFAGTHWRQFLDIGSAGQVLRQSEGVGFSTRNNVDLGREFDTRINALKALVAAYADRPTIAAGFQADLDMLQARRAALGDGARVSFIDLDPATARSGSIQVTGTALQGSGALVAPGDASIRVNNASSAFLSVKNAAGAADCPAALCIPGDQGGEITFNGARVGSNADINLRNAPGVVATLARVDERGNMAAPLIELRNTGSASASGPAPEIQVYGDLQNARGTVRIASTGSVTVSGDVSASTVDIATQGDFIKTFTLGFTHSAGDPTLTLKALQDANEQKSRTLYPAAKDPLTVLLQPNVSTSSTSNSVPQPSGTVIAGNNVFISGEKLNLNGTIQSGIADVRITIDDKALDAAKAANGGWVTLTNTAAGTLDAALRPRLRWNAATQTMELGNITVQGGTMQLYGDIFSTGNGQLNVLDGYGRIDVTNSTTAPLLLNRLDTGAGTAGRIRITDTSTLDSNGAPLVTTITRVNGQVVSDRPKPTVENGPYAEVNPNDSTGRQASYQPKALRRLNWVDADNLAVTYSQIYTRTCLISCDLGAFGDFLAKNAPTQSQVVAPPAVYTPRLGGLWLSSNDHRSGDYLYEFTKQRYDEKGTQEYFVIRYRSGLGGANENVVTRRDWTWKERNFYTHSLAASKPVAIRFIGSDSGTLNVTGQKAPLLLGDTLRNLVGATTLDATSITLSGATSGGQVLADALTLRARGGGIGLASSTGLQPLPVQLGASGSLSLQADGDVALRAWQGGLRLGDRIVVGGALQLQAEGDIVRAAGATRPLQASTLSLLSDNGRLGSADAPLLIDLPASRGTLTAHAGRDIAITEVSGDLRVAQVASSGGDVTLRAATGAIVDADSSQSVNQETRDALLAVARRAGLTADSGAGQGVQATLDHYAQSKQQDYQRYWQLRGLTERFNANGVSLGFAAKAYDATYAYTIDAATAAQLKATNGWTDAQLAAWRDSQTAFYHQAAAEFGRGDVRSYDPAWRFDLAAHPELRTQLASGGIWTEAQITQRVAAGLFKDTADTQVAVEQPNVSGRSITLQAAAGIGSASAAIDIPRDPRQWTPDQQLALLAADRADLQVTPGSVRITPKDDLNLAMAGSGVLRAQAGGSIYLGSEGALRLDSVASGNGDVRIKARGALTQAAAGHTAVSGRDVLLEAGAGTLGTATVPVQLATGSGGSVTARAADALALQAAQALVIDQIFTPAAATLSATGAVLPRQADGALRVHAGALTLQAGATIGSDGDPLAALAVAVDGPLQLSAVNGAWLSASGNTLQLASAAVSHGPLRVAAAVPTATVSGVVTAGGSVDLQAAGALTLAPASRIEAAALTLSARGPLQALGTLVVAGDSQLRSGGALLLAGSQQLGGALQLNSAAGLTLRGSGRVGGTLSAGAGGALRQQGSLTVAGSVRLDAQGAVQWSGLLGASGDVSVHAGGDLVIDGLMQLRGQALLVAAGDWALRGVLQAGTVDAQAGRDMAVGGLLRSRGDARLHADRDLRLSGLASAGGALLARAERDLAVTGRMPVAAGGVVLEAGRRKQLPPRGGQ
jgi:filamentous hemagglutinin family protein